MDLSVQPLQNPGTIASVGTLGNQVSLNLPNQPSSGVDRQALNLTRAIALAESGSKGKPNYQAVGDNGTSFGAYQWNGAEKFAAKAKQFGLDPTDFSPENQDKVAYAEIKSWKDAGLEPAEIAAKWNSGGQDNFLDHSGTTVINGKEISYDTPAYVQKVKANYINLSKQTPAPATGFNPNPFSQPISGQEFHQDVLSQNPGTNLPSVKDELLPVATKGFWSDLGHSLSNRASYIGGAVSDTFKGKINPVSGLLHTAGGLAGGLGDLTNKALEVIPGVKLAEDEIGLGAGALAKTSAGKYVAKSLNDFSTAHPELSADMNDTFNIITALPILKGLNAVKGAVLDSASTALKSAAEKAAVKDLTEVASRTVAGREALQAVPDGLQTLVEKRALPNIVTNGNIAQYEVGAANKVVNQSISSIDDELTAELKKANLPQVSSRLPLATVRQQAVDIAENELKDPGPIQKVFDRIQKKFGDYPTLEQYQDAKRKISKQITDAAFGDPEMTNNKSVRKALQTAVEQGAEKLGLENVNTINKRMAHLIKSQDLLDAIDGKAVKNTSLLHAGLKNAATGAGEIVGNSFGLPPLAGGFIGRGVGGVLDNTVGKLAQRNLVSGILDRTAAGAVKPPVLGKLKGAAAGALVQKAGKR